MFTLAPAIAVALVALLAVPNLALASAPSTNAGSAALSIDSNVPTVIAGLNLNATGYNLSSSFWGTTVTPRVFLLPNEGPIVNATPTQTVIWPGAGAGDDYDPFNNMLYRNDSAPVNATTSEAEFVAWCRSTNCSAIFELPGEIDDASLAAQIVNYTENTLDFHPAYWEVGNEPELWWNWGVPWSRWQYSSPLTLHKPTPVEYAWEVYNYTIAVRAVDPSIRLIGIPATGRQNSVWTLSEWVTNTTEVNGPNLSGVAVHVYPGRGLYGQEPQTLTAFYAAIRGPDGIEAHVQQMRGAIVNASQNISCAACASIPVFVTEVGSGLSHFGDSVYADTLPGGLDLAAQAILSMDINVSSFDLYAGVGSTANSWITPTGVARPDYTVYADLLSHLGTVAYPASLTVPANLDQYNTSLGANLYAIATTSPGDGDRADLLVVNLNTSTAVTFAPQLPGVAAGTPAEAWQWSGEYESGNGYPIEVPTTPAPVAQSLPTGLPSAWTLPPQSIAVFQAYPAEGVPVSFNESGLPSGARWFVSLNGSVAVGNTTPSETGGPTYFLHPGTYGVSYPVIPLPVAARIPSGLERMRAVGPSTIVVGSSPVNITVDYVIQWHLNISASPSVGGTISAFPTWYDANTSLNLTAQAAPGYVFSHWFGFGNGSVTSDSPEVTVWANTSIKEQAVFDLGYPVTFVATGLPAGANWSVSVLGQTYYSSSQSLTFEERNGSFGYTVLPTDGYGVRAENSSFNVTGAALVVPLNFYFLPPYQVTFVEAGLPAETTWEVAVRGVTQTTQNSSLVFWAPNGTSGFVIGAVPGYHSVPGASSFTLDQGPATIYVSFTPVNPPPFTYSVLFVESGLPSQTSWWVSVRDVTVTSSTDRIEMAEANGSYGYRAYTLVGYRTGPTHGFTVAGSSLVVDIPFTPILYAVVWRETGLGADAIWNVTVAGNQTTALGAWATARLPNGTYAFEIGPVPGFEVEPRSGMVTVAGSAVVLSVSFERPMFSVSFRALGVPYSARWEVRLSDTSGTAHGGADGFEEPNGTYTYDVTPPTGYYADPSHGNVTVNGSDDVMAIAFHPLGPGVLTPPLWNLAAPALSVATALALSALGTLALVSYLGRRDRARLKAGSPPAAKETDPHHRQGAGP